MNKPFHFDVEAFRAQAMATRQQVYEKAVALASSDGARQLIEYQHAMNEYRIEISVLGLKAKNEATTTEYAQAMGAMLAQLHMSFSQNFAADSDNVKAFMAGYDRAQKSMKGETPGGAVFQNCSFNATEGGNA